MPLHEQGTEKMAMLSKLSPIQVLTRPDPALEGRHFDQCLKFELEVTK